MGKMCETNGRPQAGSFHLPCTALSKFSLLEIL
jgi:hypothetical protein